MNFVKIKLLETYKDFRSLQLTKFSEKSFLFNEDHIYNDSLKLNNNYTFLRKTPFIEFFKTNFIDVPVCFSNSISLKRNKNKTLGLILGNHIMKNGYNIKILKYMIKSFYSISSVGNQNNET